MNYILRTKEEKYDDLISDEYMKGSYAVYGKMLLGSNISKNLLSLSLLAAKLLKLYVIPVHPYTWLNKAYK